MASTIDNSNIIELNEKDVPGAALNKSPEASSVLELKRWLEKAKVAELEIHLIGSS